MVKKQTSNGGNIWTSLDNGITWTEDTTVGTTNIYSAAVSKMVQEEQLLFYMEIFGLFMN